jgi:FMN reductase
MASQIVLIAGSPSRSTRSASLFGRIIAGARNAGLAAQTIEVRDLPPADLTTGARDSAALAAAIAALAGASGVVVATPVYKAAYTGLLKCFLDVLPESALRDKIVFPIVTAASPAHALALDYALKPVLASLFPSKTLSGFFAIDGEFVAGSDGALELKPEAAARLDAMTNEFLSALGDPRAADRRPG